MSPDQESVDAAFAAAWELDALISNAGETLRAPAESVPLTEVTAGCFQLNTVGALRCRPGGPCPGMRASRPRAAAVRLEHYREGCGASWAGHILRASKMGAGRRSQRR